MRTTLNIDEDILLAAKDIAQRRNQSAGEVLSMLARQALPASNPASGVRNGVEVFAAGPDTPILTLEMVNRLRDD